MGISLKPEHLKRYKDIALLLMKYGRSDLVKNAGLEDILKDEETDAGDVPPEAESLADDLERMGPTFIKLGQLLSTRADLLPLPYMQALSRLQDKVEPFSFEEVEQIITSELGVRISKAFASFDAEPMAAASLGQVHRATMRNGRPVAVKVQRPGIREQIIKDLEAMSEVAQFLDEHTEMGKRYEFQKMLDEFRKSILAELDYRREAQNLVTISDNLIDFDAIVIPQPVEDYTTSRVLTMDYIRGRKITDLDPLTRMDIDGAELAGQLFRAYLQQFLVDGFFHADPHPGNVFLTDDGQIALIDLGMVARITPGMQERLLQLLLAISEGRAEQAADVAMQIGQIREGFFDETDFRRRVGDLVTTHQDASLGQIEVGTIVLEVTKASGECGIRVPPDLTMLGKTLLNLDQVGRTLDPSFDPNEAIRQYASEIFRQRLTKSLSPGNLFSSVLEMKEFFEKLPGRINKILDSVANNEIKVKVDALDEHLLMEGLQKIANRITLGLVLAALIVGAAMLMNVPTDFKILGYPGLAIIFFLVAATGGVLLVLNILFYDEKAKK
ncbi:MAG TPA: AarF/ABC1/UbiB kinase family protein [Blastocatellia bacterium]|nr:AarF/ABC1/UbiB kinase family protein [Blastocatellia bacterium]